jgi:hypothetical protein
LGYVTDEDELTQRVRGFAIVAVILGAFGLAGVFLVSHFGASWCAWKFYGILFLFTSFFQGLSLLIYRSSICTDNPFLQILDDRRAVIGPLRDTFPDTCVKYVGYNCGIASTVLWLFLGIAILFVPAPEKWSDDWCSESIPMPEKDSEIIPAKKPSTPE